MFKSHSLYSTVSNVTRKFLSNSNKSTIGIAATGGNDVFYENGYTYHVFTGPGSLVVSQSPASGAWVDYVVVAGGGGGGAGAVGAANGGGGGAGGFRTGEALQITGGTYPITIGGGGAADAQGNPSIFSTITSTGGGYGGGSTANIGGSGGSGGGGRTVAGGPYAGGSGNTPLVSPPQGNNGGSSNISSPYQAGGGGGAGEAGNTDGLGTGGDGSPITWVPASYGTPGTNPGRYFAGGGSGGEDNTNIAGGEGGGGSGSRGAWPANPGSTGTTNTGGGGGGGASQPPAIAGLSGGSGIIIVRYPTITQDTLGTINNPATSASQLIANGFTTDGVYYINLPTVGVTPVYCILNPAYDGGGWMMAMKATTGTTFNYNANYWTTANTLNPTDLSRANADAKFDTMNYFQAKDMMAVFPDISNGGSIAGSTIGWTWLQNDFYSGIRITPISLFNTVSRYFIRDAKTFTGWASGVFSSQVDVRFYGFNYQNTAATPTAKVRWGFGWNENGGGLYPGGNEASNDVSGGIGMAGIQQGQVNYSAGDFIGCCQDTTGINRSARVEIYIR